MAKYSIRPNSILFLLLPFLFTLVSCGPQTGAEEERARDIQQYTIEQFMDNTAYSGGAFSPQESRLLVTSNASGIYNAYEIPVLKVESDEIVAAARENDVPVEYVVFEDEGHGFVKKENQIEAYSRILEFLNQYLKKGEALKG
mgnify:CR=1 FL=1